MNTRFSVVMLASAGCLAMAGTLSAQQSVDHLSAHGDLRPRTYAGPPLSLIDALREAAEHNPELVALQARVAAAAERPAQARALGAPILRAQIWQWPFNSLDPASANM